MSEHLFASAEWLEGGNNHGYGPLPIPQPLDSRISELLQTWLALDSRDRLAAAIHILPGQRPVLRAFGDRMATLAVRESSADRIDQGLLALGLSMCGGDTRDAERILSLHYDAARRLAANADVLFGNVAQVLPAHTARALRTFVSRAEEDKTLQVMGYLAGADADGFRYERML